MEDVRSTAECIRDGVVLPLLVPDDERVVLQVLYPPGVPITNLLLILQMSQGTMVGIEHELLRKEIVSPVSQRLDKGVKLTIVVIIPALRVVQLLTKVLDGMSFLAKDSSNTYSRGVASYLEHSLEVR